jgi:SAM-dependent methyltransferase
MSVTISNVKRTYTSVPPIHAQARLDRLARALAGSALFPFYWLGAHRYGLPGLRFGIDSFWLGLRSLIGKNDDVSHSEIYRMLFAPIESTRYFEFGAAWDFLSGTSIGHYLDVSSPRLFPLALVTQRQEAVAELINPDKEDLRVTAGIVRGSGLSDRCTFWNCLLEDAPFDANTFDLITSISVIEHIPDDKNAALEMWRLLKPGGRLLLSVPCAAVAEEQYIDVDQFGLQKPCENEFFFLQYVYDQPLLQQRFYNAIGPPIRHAIYGEKEPGSLRRSLIKKWTGEKYARWREPYTMAQEFQRYDTVEDLPGEGVIVMEFEKASSTA